MAVPQLASLSCHPRPSSQLHHYNLELFKLQADYVFLWLASLGQANRTGSMRIPGTLATIFSLALLPASAAAQDFPAKPIRLIVPFPAGGPNDIIARVVGQRMSELIKQPVLIDNRGGQGGGAGNDR